jgi:hypothetical protein
MSEWGNPPSITEFRDLSRGFGNVKTQGLKLKGFGEYETDEVWDFRYQEKV